MNNPNSYKCSYNFCFVKNKSFCWHARKSNQAPIHYEIPRAAVAEAIVNAVAHRDYSSRGSVQVMLFTDRLEIVNPGHLAPELSIPMLKIEHGSYPTNPKLAECLYQAGYIERFGTGLGEIFRLSKEL